MDEKSAEERDGDGGAAEGSEVLPLRQDGFLMFTGCAIFSCARFSLLADTLKD